MSIPFKAVALALALLLPVASSAHKAFLLPSTTVLSDGNDAWVTVDAAVSNDLFYFNHMPMALDGLVVTAPDGTALAPENSAKGKLRSTFDLHLTQAGTYRIAVVSDGLMANYEDVSGAKKRARGRVGALDIPAGAKNVKVTQVQNSVESFVTLGKPSEDVLKPKGSGLELVPVTHPNDLVAGEEARFRFLFDGKPASGLKVSVVPGDTRYRDHQDEISVTTDAEGRFALTWPKAGMYWLNASSEGKASVKEASARRAGYTATLEVMPD